MANLLGPAWPELRDALDGPALRAVRLHRIGELRDRDPGLSDPGLPIPSAVGRYLRSPVPWASDGFYIAANAPLGKLVYHELGAYYLQEPSAMAVVEALDPKPGERVLDLCAAPGGKTTAVARRLKTSSVASSGGALVANEIHPKRVRILGQNLERLGVAALITNETPTRLAAVWPNQFDAILVDAPCSGEGMFRKDPASRLSWSTAEVTRCALRQRDILSCAITLLKPGGRIAYSTCTFNPEENEQVVAWLCKTHGLSLVPLPNWPGWVPARPDWADGNQTIEHARHLWPQHGAGEGHFVALLRKDVSVAGPFSDSQRPSSESASRARSVQQTGRCPVTSGDDGLLQGRPRQEWNGWLRELTSAADTAEKWQQPWLHDKTLFTDETAHLPTWGLRVLRPGVCLATVENGRFRPHHHWAMSVHGAIPRNPLAGMGCAVSAHTAVDYFSGAALPLSSTPSAHADYVWVHTDGLPAGWAKPAPGRLNNLYPKGLRRQDLLPE